MAAKWTALSVSLHSLYISLIVFVDVLRRRSTSRQIVSYLFFMNVNVICVQLGMCNVVTLSLFISLPFSDFIHCLQKYIQHLYVQNISVFILLRRISIFNSINIYCAQYSTSSYQIVAFTLVITKLLIYSYQSSLFIIIGSINDNGDAFYQILSAVYYI